MNSEGLAELGELRSERQFRRSGYEAALFSGNSGIIDSNGRIVTHNRSVIIRTIDTRGINKTNDVALVEVASDRIPVNVPRPRTNLGARSEQPV